MKKVLDNTIDIQSDNKNDIQTEEVKCKNVDKITFYKLVCIYLIGGITGTLWETLLNFISGEGFVWCNGSLFTPFNLVYGFGAVAIIFCLYRQTKVWKVYLIGAIGGGAVEYILSFLEEHILGTRSWDYQDEWLNINGRTTIIFMAFWGVLCVALYFIYKPFNRLLEKIPHKVIKIFSIVMTVIVVIDMIMTVSVILRYSTRNSGRKAELGIEAFIDNVCDDEFMQERFPHMNFA